VIPGEGRVPILYGNQPMAIAPHRDGYVARPDAVAPHPAVAIASSNGPDAASKTLARHLARYGYAVVIPPADRRQLAAAVEALGSAWWDWSRGDRRAVLGIGAGAAVAAEVAAAGGLALILLSPESAAIGSGTGPTLILGPAGGASGGFGKRITYRGVGPGFWDDASPDFAPAAAGDALRRIVEFLDRYLGAAVAA
jgi:hypothetical protein